MQLNDSSAASWTRRCISDGVDRGVGGDEAEHRRHVRMDHAGALADAGHGHGAAAELHGQRRGLGHGIRRHDRLGGIGPAVGPRVGQRRRQRRLDPLVRQRFHDHAGGKRQHLLGAAAEQPRRARRTSSARAPGRRRRCRRWRCRYSRGSPVRRRPPPRCSRQSWTGAAQNRFAVKTPATEAPGSSVTTVRSRRFALRMPAIAVPRERPATGWMSCGAGVMRLTAMVL